MLLVAPGITTSSKKLLVTKGIATRSKDAFATCAGGLEDLGYTIDYRKCDIWPDANTDSSLYTFYPKRLENRKSSFAEAKRLGGNGRWSHRRQLRGPQRYTFDFFWNSLLLLFPQNSPERVLTSTGRSAYAQPGCRCRRVPHKLVGRYMYINVLLDVQCVFLKDREGEG